MSLCNKKLKNNYYIIRKNYLSQPQKLKLVNDLTIKPNTNNYSKEIEPYKIFKETKSSFRIPKYYGIKEFGEPDINLQTMGTKINKNFNGFLFDYQKTIIDKINFEIKNNMGTILTVGCGKGKTIMAIKMIEKIKRKTLIVVHKEFLEDQWKERIDTFLPGCKIVKVDNKKGYTQKSQEADIIIAMTQTLCKAKFKIPDCGFMIIDEVHHCASKVFSKFFFKFGTRYTLGLSATPERDDGCHNLLFYHIGNIGYRGEIEKNNNLNINIIHYKTRNNKYFKTEFMYNGDINRSKMITNITLVEERNTLIYNIVDNCLKENPQRNILILSERVDHLKHLNELLNYNKFSSGLYIGDMSQKKRKKSESCQIICATYHIVSEGFDLKKLNTLIFATPRKKIVQSIGRIQRKRKSETKIKPIVFDIVDSLPTFDTQLYSRIKIYNQYGYSITNYENDGENYKLTDNDVNYEKYNPQNKKTFQLSNQEEENDLKELMEL